MIVKQFEQTHTDQELYDSTAIFVGFDQTDSRCLDPATGLVP